MTEWQFRVRQLPVPSPICDAGAHRCPGPWLDGPQLRDRATWACLAVMELRRTDSCAGRWLASARQSKLAQARRRLDGGVGSLKPQRGRTDSDVGYGPSHTGTNNTRRAGDAVSDNSSIGLSWSSPSNLFVPLPARAIGFVVWNRAIFGG